ncbi:PAS domain-containing protein [Xanthomonas sp. AM6]|uniref:PAS domain-containing protein n=1 Tax=Xanthomonas sp. AM6 TaxID=2982531 RepID=UPI0021D9DBFF|nr:PAS domain-containing protein [Xanthomonas sp. AM6]UYB53696.1 PAS domain-containing protein [Xanthomonas sp. AM6]
MTPDHATSDTEALAYPFLHGGGRTGALIARFDWSRTPLGPLSEWPQSLRTVTAMLLRSPLPIVLLWGREGIMIYNDAYAVFAGARHPQLLGSEVRQGWAEVAEFNDNVMKVGLAGRTLSYKDQELTLHRNGRPEQVWMDLDYSPVLDDSGVPAGVIAFVVDTTERVRAQAHIQAERTRLTRLFDQAPGLMMMLTGREHVVELANPAFVRLMGGGALLGLPIREALPDMARPDFLAILDDAYRSGTAFVANSAKFQLQHAGQAHERILDFVCQPVTGPSGEVTGIFIEGHDVTEQRRAADALHANERRLRFLDALAKATAASTEAGAILATTTRMLGEYLGVSVCAYADMDPDQDGFTIRGDWSAPGARSITGHYSLTAFGRLAVGNLRAGLPLVLDDNRAQLPPEEAATFLDIGLAATICMPLVKEGRLTALMAIHDRVPHRWTQEELSLLTEVTERSWAHIERVRSEAQRRLDEQRFLRELERKVAERTAELAQSQSNIRTVLETSHLFQGLLDLDGRLRYTNATALQGIGARLDDILGWPLWTTPWFAQTDGAPALVEAAVRRVAAGATEHMSMTLNLPTGVRAFDLSLRPVLDAAGAAVGMVFEAVEMTARIMAEKALRQAQKMEEIGNLTGGIAHDFNNLLTVILGNLELLRLRVPDDALLHRLLDNATAGAERGAALTARMLAFARKQDLRTERLDVKALVEGMTDLLERSLGATIALQLELPTQLPAVETDANQLESALLNLAVNARDAMDGQGRILIAARTTRRRHAADGLRPGRYVCLAVTDTGTGMDEATLKRAAEPFFTTKGVGKGTGLGLSMVHGLAQQCGGALLIHSTPGLGTTAEIWLPAADATAADLAPPAPRAPAAPEAVAGPLKILAVDDDRLVLANTAQMLGELGHQVAVAGSGPEALATLAQQRFDLVVTDYAMPDMTGMQLAVAIRQAQPALPILLVSGYTDLAPGAHPQIPRLPKPYSRASLARAVVDAVGTGANASAAPARGN